MIKFVVSFFRHCFLDIGDVLLYCKGRIVVWIGANMDWYVLRQANFTIANLKTIFKVLGHAHCIIIHYRMF